MEENGEKPGFGNIIALGLVSFFTDFSTEMILGLLPVFIVEQLGGSRVIVGLIEGVADLLNYLFRVFSGVISDILGVRKRIVILGYAVSNFSKPLFAFTNTWTQALLVRSMDRVGKGIRTSARDALLSESARKGMVGRAFGIHRTLDQMGAIVGPALASLLLPVIYFRGVFLASLIPGLAALLILLFFVKEVKRAAPKKQNLISNVREVLYGGYRIFLVIVALFTLGSYGFSFILLRARLSGIEVAAIPLLYAGLNIAHTIAGIPSGILADKMGGLKTLVLTYMLFSASSLIAGLCGPTVYVSILVAAIYGFYLGMLETVQRALVSNLSQPHVRATAYGVYYLVVGCFTLIANIVFGFLWDSYGVTVAFIYSTITSLTSATLLSTFTKTILRED